jgi:hypothetical protein
MKPGALPMDAWTTTKWRYKALAVSIVANSAIAISVPVFGYFTAWMLIPGTYVAFWLCNDYSFSSGCSGRNEYAAWIVGWLLNVLFCWGAVWAIGLLRARRRV